MQTTLRTIYGDAQARRQRPSVVLLSPHDGPMEWFVGECPALLAACPADAETLARFCALERDVGATALAHRIATLLVERGVVRVDVVEVCLPRGIVDGNRLTERALRNIFPADAYPDLVRYLHASHASVLTSVRESLALLSPTGIFVDVHTMAPYTPAVDPQSPTETIAEHPDALHHVIETWTNRARWRERRHVDVVTRLSGTDALLADPLLRVALVRYLSEHEVPWRENLPYPTAEHVLTTHYLRQRRGVAIDVPKDVLGATPAEHESFDLLAPTIDAQRVGRIAEPVASAIIEALGRQ
ncbi:MAG: hypothetical protein Q7T01_02130 [bacterium]|nr:hypothetical protein [bacterium]